MERPYVICHILSSLNGKIAGPFMGTEANGTVAGEYGRLRREMKGDAWLYGTVTTKEFVGEKKPDYSDISSVPEGDYVAADQAELYYVSLDTAGEIPWESGTYSAKGRPDAHVIEILTESTPKGYRDYLRSRKVSYILAGKKELDCRVAAEKLRQLFGIRKLLICGGGGVNWTFLQAGVADELSLVLSPAADGEPGFPSVFERMGYLPAGVTAEFSLKEINRLVGDGVQLVYKVNHHAPEANAPAIP